MPNVRDLYDLLQPDTWRTRFSDDVESVHRSILQPNASVDDITRESNSWLAQHQPCLFGKIAAKQGLIRYCVLNESILTASDADIQAVIQDARFKWHADAYDGRASGFVILAVSQRLALARPDSNLAALAARICELYLLQEVPFDAALTDSIYLEKPGYGRRTWKWLVGANFFGAQGDLRWWHDHRIPGGIAFSMNSVGHMAKSGAINRAMAGLDKEIGETAEDWDERHVESLDKALVLAMRTIRVASEGQRPGTHLFTTAERPPSLECPIRLPPDIRDKNYCEYFGYYHTDHTLPLVYFRDAVERPADVKSFTDLDFTYLFDSSAADLTTMGQGLRVRAGGVEDQERRSRKEGKVVATDVSIDDEDKLRVALERRAR